MFLNDIVVFIFAKSDSIKTKKFQSAVNFQVLTLSLVLTLVFLSSCITTKYIHVNTSKLTVNYQISSSRIKFNNNFRIYEIGDS
jgi:hypothetical protein